MEGTMIFCSTAKCARLLLGIAVIAACGAAWPIQTKVVRDETFAEFNQGETTGIELLAQGRLRVAPQAHRIDKTEEGVAWRVAVDPYDGHVFFVTGHNGKVFHYAPGGKVELWAKLSEVEATSVAIDPKGAVLVGVSPGGKIYRIPAQNKAELFFDTKEHYIWDMIFDRDGLLYAATGTNGKIFRIRGQNNGEVFYDSDATNVMALNFDRDGDLIAATQGKAYVLHVLNNHSAYVLYAAREDECRALAVDQAGNIYAAINGARSSSGFERPSDSMPAMAGALATPAIPGAGVVVTLTGSATPTPMASPGIPSSGGQSQVVQIQPNGFVTNFWQSPEGPIQGMITESNGRTVLVAAGNKGKIYRFESDTNYSVVADVEEPSVLSFARQQDHVYFVTANKASLYEMVSNAPRREGLFASRALNAGSTVHWGNIYYEAEETSGSELLFETRTGNTPEPEDKSWSEWTQAKRVGPRALHVDSPIAQYLQYRLTMRAPAAGDSPLLDNVQIFHVQKNVLPILREIRVEKVGGEGGGAAADLALLLGGARRTVPTPRITPRVGSSAGSSPYSPGIGIELAPGSMLGGGGRTPGLSPAGSDGADSGPYASAVGVAQNSQKFNVSWDVQDPNGDKLQFKLHFKGEDETVWKLAEKELTSPRYTFSTEAIPDGKYRLMVEATDALENADVNGTTVSLVSRIFNVDNTPPDIADLRGRRVGNNEYEITAKGSDATSILSAAEYNMDASKEWKGVFPEDGIFDFYTETFKFRAKPEKESPEHTLSLRLYDREGNSRVEKVLLR